MPLQTLRAKLRPRRSPLYIFLGPSSARSRRQTRGAMACRPLLPEQRLEPLFEFLERYRAPKHHAVEEEGRRRSDLQFLNGVLLVGGELVELCLVRLAGFDILFAHAVLLADIEQRIFGF